MEICSPNIYLLIYLSVSHVLCSECMKELLGFVLKKEKKKLTNMRLCKYMVIAHKTIKSSLTKKLILKL